MNSSQILNDRGFLYFSILNYIEHYLPLLHCQSSSNNEHIILTSIFKKNLILLFVYSKNWVVNVLFKY